ncbi:MAG: hypothetical protein QOD75_2527 [Blastocatellia bacterium]|jgi:hypothetical protein|nr:hypothetical protein [Blastocatellia bacterium]
MLNHKTVARVSLLAVLMTPLNLLAMPSSAHVQKAAPGVKGIWVRLARSQGGHEITHVPQNRARVTRTDEQGNFGFADVTPGEYVLTVSVIELKPEAASEAGSRMSTGESKDPSTMPNNTLRPGNDPRNQAPTVGTGGTPGGPTGLLVSGFPNKVLIVISEGAGRRIEMDWDFSEKSTPRAPQATYGGRPGRTGEAQIVLKVEGGTSRTVRGEVSLIK